MTKLALYEIKPSGGLDLAKTLANKGGRRPGNRTDHKHMLCWLEGSYRKDPITVFSAAPWPQPSNRKVKGNFWQIKVPLSLTMVIPPPKKKKKFKKKSCIAAVMYGWHYLHVVVVLHFFLKMVDPQGKNWGDFLYTSVSRQLRGRQLLLRGCYVQTDFMYRVILSHTYTCTMPPKAPELKARSVGSWPKF